MKKYTNYFIAIVLTGVLLSNLWLNVLESAEAQGANVNPWLATSQGNIYVETGSLNNSAPAAGTYFALNPTKAKLSEFNYTSKNTPNNSSRASANNMWLFNYDLGAAKPPVTSGFTNWYDYFEKLLSLNSTITERRTLTTITGNFSTALSTTANNATPQVFRANPNQALRVVSNSVCNVKAIILVQSLIIEPSVRISNPTLPNACLFIVKNDVSIRNTGAAANGLSIDSKVYDLLQLGVIAGGNITADYDNTDALKFEGLLTGNNITLNRDIQDSNYPSVWVEFDPRYTEYFRNEFKLVKFSTREKGFAS